MNICIIEDCDNKTVAKGLCMKHYRRKLRKGTTDIVRRADKTCIIDGCTKGVYARDLCTKHHRAWTLYGNPLYEGKGQAKGKTCILSLCDNEVRCKDLCSTHYASYISYQKRRPNYTYEGYLEWKEERMRF